MTKVANRISFICWVEFDGNFAQNTLYYGEYKNTGPGASTSGRGNGLVTGL
ncbi:hypothetical protein Peur_072817 [Populus x canadensis]